MQHRYRVMNIPEGWLAQVANLDTGSSDDAWLPLKLCATKWGAIHACKKDARATVEYRKNPVWEATLPYPVDLS